MNEEKQTAAVGVFSFLGRCSALCSDGRRPHAAGSDGGRRGRDAAYGPSIEATSRNNRPGGLRSPSSSQSSDGVVVPEESSAPESTLITRSQMMPTRSHFADERPNASSASRPSEDGRRPAEPHPRVGSPPTTTRPSAIAGGIGYMSAQPTTSPKRIQPPVYVERPTSIRGVHLASLQSNRPGSPPTSADFGRQQPQQAATPSAAGRSFSPVNATQLQSASSNKSDAISQIFAAASTTPLPASQPSPPGVPRTSTADTASVSVARRSASSSERPTSPGATAAAPPNAAAQKSPPLPLHQRPTQSQTGGIQLFTNQKSVSKFIIGHHFCISCEKYVLYRI